MTEPAEQQIKRIVFRLPVVGVLAALLLAAGATPIAVAAPLGWLIYLIPLAIIIWMLRTRTVADAEGMVARTVFSRTEVAWSELRSLRLQEKSWVHAVLLDGREVTLPAVRTRSVPLLAAVSGGVVPDPTAVTAPDETTVESTESVDSTGNGEADGGQPAPEPDETGEPKAAE